MILLSHNGDSLLKNSTFLLSLLREEHTSTLRSWTGSRTKRIFLNLSESRIASVRECVWKSSRAEKIRQKQAKGLSHRTRGGRYPRKVCASLSLPLFWPMPMKKGGMPAIKQRAREWLICCR